MGSRHEVLAFGRIANSYDAVRDAWLEDPLGILRQATATKLSGLFGARLHATVGPFEIASEIVTDLVALEHYRLPNGTPATKLVIEWAAMRSSTLFPTMHATLSIHPLTATETALELRGRYEPPLGFLGRAADAIALHHVAKASVAHFVEEIAQRLGRSVSEGTASTR